MDTLTTLLAFGALIAAAVVILLLVARARRSPDVPGDTDGERRARSQSYAKGAGDD